MAIDLFRVMQGLDIQLDDLSANANLLVGTGLPGGDAGEQDAAPIGSIYMRADAETNGHNVYWKFATGGSSFADWKTIVDKNYVDALVSGISWREPVVVLDTTLYANVTAAESAANGGNTVDGIGITGGERILLSNLTAGNENVYIVSGSAGFWTFTEDTNLATDGDALLIQQGTSADQQYIFDGTGWILFGASTSAAELGYIRAFMGKSGPDSELPTYTSTDVIAQSDNLEVAIGKLDDAMGTGEITNDGGNYALSDDMAWAAAGTLEVSDALDEINVAIGNRTFTSSGTNITDGDSNALSIDNLNEALIPLQAETLEIAGNNVVATATVTADTLALADATEAKWIVQVRETTTPANRRSVEIHAMNDGATLVDHTSFAVLKLGSPIAGFNVAADISGTDMRLRITATNNIDYVVKRIAYSAF